MTYKVEVFNLGSWETVSVHVFFFLARRSLFKCAHRLLPGRFRITENSYPWIEVYVSRYAGDFLAESEVPRD